MQRSTDRILTTHVGSLIRPLPVLKLMRSLELGEPIDQQVFDTTVKQAVDEVIDEQVSAGIDILNDGEMGRAGFSRYVYNRIEGIEPRELNPGEDVWGGRPDVKGFPGFYSQYDNFYRRMWMHPEVSLDELPNVPGNFERFRVVGPVKYRGMEALQKEIANLKSAVARHNIAEAFIPATHPGGRAHQDFQKFYPSEEAYRFALADVFHEEYKAITDAGFLLQIDYPNVHTAAWLSAAERAEVDRAVDMGIEALNYALRDIPEEMVRFHYCWGSMNVPHLQDSPLRDIVHLIFRVKAQAYSIEGANPRHEHEWQVWKDVKLPDGKILIPGVISHQTNVVEHPELVAWRIQNFASVAGKENVIAGADCGFSQFWDSIRVHPEVQWAKLRSLAEGAAIASRALWS